MSTTELGKPRRRSRSRFVLAGGVLVLLVAAVACRPLPLGGGPTNRIGNDVANCAQFQPASSVPCGPQPMFWSTIAGPYAAYADGDPYATKCERNGTASPEACSAGIYTGGATNPFYDPSGYEFAVTVKAADVGKPLSLQVWDAGSYPRTVGASTANDCATNAAPFTSAPYSGVVGPERCQTGDSGAAPFEAQLFDNDGDDLTIDLTTPIVPCRLFVAPAGEPGTYKNKWATVCTFTPTAAGVFPLRVKSSNIAPPGGPAVTDTGDGANSFALRVTGATATTVTALDQLAINANTPAADTRFYLTDVRSQEAGKRLRIDIFDPGDGSTGDSSIQILGPPAGAPSTVPTGGATIPSAALASSCRYNAVASVTKGPTVGGSQGTASPTCTVVTRSGGVNRYDGGWLRIEITISATYSCAVDCWWTVRYQNGAGADGPADRMVWSALIADPPAA